LLERRKRAGRDVEKVEDDEEEAAGGEAEEEAGIRPGQLISGII
jgi:hypothetical protein